MYRSFVKCDDPKGVVECGKIRKYRTCSQKAKDMIKIQKPAQNLETSSINKGYKEEVSKGSIEKFFDPPSLQQLAQVSGGDQSLNNMIDSRSSNLMYQERRSKDIAKSWLKGAHDLQDSLVMLTKMQEVSKQMVSLKKEQAEKPKRDRIDTKIFDTTHANQFSDQSDYPMGFQPSADGSSSNCKEELKKVIKESLVGQNQFPSTTTERLDSASETPSTSPSRSPEGLADRFSDPSYSPTASQMERRPNLVAKLMGLEEAPSRSLPSDMQKQLDGEKFLNQKRPTFEIDMHKVRKNSSIAEKVNPERKSLREKTLENMHFKGLLKKSFVKEPKLQVHYFNDPYSKKFDDLSYIVPPYQESVKPLVPDPPEELSPRKLKEELVSSKTIKHRKGSGSTKMEKDVSKWITKEERPRFLKEVVKLDAKGINPIEDGKCPGKVKLYCHISNISQVNETSDKECNEQSISRKLLENDISEPTIVASPQLKPQTKNQNPVAEPAAKPIGEQIRQGKKSIDVPCMDDYTEITIAATLSVAAELFMRCEADASTNKIREECKRNKSSSCDEIMLLKSKHENDSIPPEEAHESTNSMHEKERTELKHFLLTTQSFISHAEKLFNLDVDYPKILQKDETNEINDNLRLYLDCANELTELKSLQESQAIRSSLQTCVGNSRLHISLGKLVEEMYNAIENLKFCSEREKLFVDNIFATMEKDMKCNRVMNGIWECGWNHGFSADEVGLVVNEIESMLVSGLIEEVII